MKIDSKYDVGDKVWKIKFGQVRKDDICTFCGGERKVTGKDGRVANCPICFGRGSCSGRTVEELWTVSDVPYEISCVHVIVQDGESRCTYSVLGETFICNEGALFLSKEEALSKCEEVNKGL